MRATEGTIPFKGLETWYRIVGDGEEPGKLPVLVLHGGPGAPHDYLESLQAVATTGRRAIFYDQLQKLLEQNTELTQQTKQLAERIDALTAQLHQQICEP